MKKIQVSEKLKLLFLMLLLLGNLACPKADSETPQNSTPAKDQTVLASGTLYLVPELKAQADPLAILFIMARSPEGRIVAVKKLLPPLEYPLAFTLTQADQMMPNQLLPKDLMLKARLDQDGNANPDQEGDIIGFSEPATFPLGHERIIIQLNQRVRN